MDDKAVEGRWRILRETAAMPQNNPKSEAEDQQCDVYHGMPYAVLRDRQIWCRSKALRCLRLACLFRSDRVADGCLAARLFRHTTPHGFRVLHTLKWTKDTLGPLNEAIESHRLVFAADNPISRSSCLHASHLTFRISICLRG